MYYTPEIIELIVKKTNEYRREPQDDSCPYTQADDWYPTYSGEIYLYFALRIYITLHIENEISDYWKTSNLSPVHLIRKYISRDRFQELYMYVRFHREEEKGLYKKVSNTSLEIP